MNSDVAGHKVPLMMLGMRVSIEKVWGGRGPEKTKALVNSRDSLPLWAPLDCEPFKDKNHLQALYVAR